MVKDWIFDTNTDQEAIDKLSVELNINSVLCRILFNRGITSFVRAKGFFNPSLSEVHDPFLMKDMDKAVARIKAAIENNEKILVYGDYDVDGTTSVAIMSLFLRKINANVDYYLPDRYTEGYGISKEGVSYAIRENFAVIISLDCGIRANTNIQYASDNNIDFIVCDHHLPGNILPSAIAILDPKRSDCNYPFKELSGCGIGFKLIQAMAATLKVPEREIHDYLDLVAVSICADIVPIIGENRILTFWGLKKLNSAPLPGLAALIRIANRRNKLKVSDVVFGIAPRINAAGRMKHAREAVRLLLSESKEVVEKGAKSLNEMNVERRSFDEQITREALEMIQGKEDLENANSTVLFHESWHKGVIGIVASRMIEHYYRPTIILTKSNGKATGSARSVKGFNIYDAISNCEDLLVQFGGHKYAAGLTMELDKIDEFIKRFEDSVTSTINENDLKPKLKIDEKINFDDINFKFIRILNRMEPFGPGNPAPIFVSERVICKSARVVGENHLKMFLGQEGSDFRFEAIAFKMGAAKNEVSSKKPFNIAFHLELNDFQGEESIQLIIKDIKFSN